MVGGVVRHINRGNKEGMGADGGRSKKAIKPRGPGVTSPRILRVNMVVSMGVVSHIDQTEASLKS